MNPIDLESLSEELKKADNQSAAEKYNEAAVYGAEERERNKEALESERIRRAAKIEEDRQAHTKVELWGIFVFVAAMLVIVFAVSQLIPMIVTWLASIF